MDEGIKSKLSQIRGNVKFVGVVAVVAVVLLLVVIANMLVTIDHGEVGIVFKKLGRELPEGAVVAPDGSYQGLQLAVLKPGWHLVNPLWTSVKTRPAVQIPKGMKGLVNLKVGTDPVNPEDIVVGDGERGFQRRPLEPGLHLLNPEIYDVRAFEPVVIPPLHVGIVTNKVGKPSTEDIVEDDEKGIRRNVLRPGTHWLNPAAYDVEITKAVEIKNGHVGVVKSRTGTESSSDLVAKGERGIWKDVLRPGTYYLNTKAYDVKEEPALQIGAGFVGVVVSRTGKEPVVPNAIVVNKGERGVQPYTLSAGLHYLNPFEFDVITIDARVQKYEMSGTDVSHVDGEVKGDDRLAFPSSDGFTVKVDSSFEWQIDTEKIPFVVASIGTTKDMVDKIIRPNAREIGRLEGSKLKAEDFIKGDKREQFVQKFSDMLRARCADRGVILHKALVREVFPPDEVAQPLKDREVALLMQATNVEKQAQAKSEALLEEERSKIEQRKELILAETSKKVAETVAEREKEVATIKAEQLKAVAKVEQEQQALIFEKQKLEAQGIREIADAEAHKARSLIEADGALDKKLAAWTSVMKMWATNSNLVPRIVVGGSGGEGGDSLTGQELILKLMAIEHLDRFSKSAALEIDDAPDAKEAPAKKPSSTPLAPRSAR